MAAAFSVTSRESSSLTRRRRMVAALFYSLAETARRVGVEPRAYFARALASALAGKAVPLPHELLTLAHESPPSSIS